LFRASGSAAELTAALQRVDRQKAGIERLEREVALLVEQFFTCAYNAHTRGLSREFLSRPLPPTHRGKDQPRVIAPITLLDRTVI